MVFLRLNLDITCALESMFAQCFKHKNVTDWQRTYKLKKMFVTLFDDCTIIINIIRMQTKSVRTKYLIIYIH